MEYSAGMMGAARDYFRMSGVGNCCSIAARGPKPPAFKRVEVRAIAAVVVILTLIAALEVSLLIRKDLAEDEHARISVPKKEFDDAMNRVQARVRSEEHTSELQSLMRNSYAVFCLKKKT